MTGPDIQGVLREERWTADYERAKEQDVEIRQVRSIMNEAEMSD